MISRFNSRPTWSDANAIIVFLLYSARSARIVVLVIALAKQGGGPQDKAVHSKGRKPLNHRGEIAPSTARQ